MENYDDIINLPHHVSTKHPRLSMEQRAAQFAPFAALTGYGDAVEETARFTEERIELEEEQKNNIETVLKKIDDNLPASPKVKITYFVPDMKKLGGKYVTIIENVKKIDKYNKCLILQNEDIIPLNEIIEINIL